MPDQQASNSSHVNIVVGVVFLVFLGQMTLNPVIAPLAREVGLAEWQVGMTISTAALMVVLTSQWWGVRSQRWGRRPVLLAGVSAGFVAMTLFVVVSWLGMRGVITAGLLFLLFLLLRGLVFGAAIAAVPPTAQAFIADVTESEEARVVGMARVGAAQGMAMIIGAALGGALAGISLLTSLSVLPVLLLIAIVLVVFRLPAQPASTLVSSAKRVSPLDSRVWPYLVAGFGMFTALGFVQVITGFVVQDRFELSAETTGVVTGSALFAAGIGMVIAQAGIVPASKWRPPVLLRVGTAIATLGFFLAAIDTHMALFIAAIGLIGLGLGIAMPGYTAGSTLHMSREEQGGLAGLIGATNGLTFVVAPTASTVMYAVWPPLPILFGGSIMFAVMIFVLVHPRLRVAASQSAAS